MYSLARLFFIDAGELGLTSGEPLPTGNCALAKLLRKGLVMGKPRLGPSDVQSMLLPYGQGHLRSLWRSLSLDAQ